MSLSFINLFSLALAFCLTIVYGGRMRPTAVDPCICGKERDPYCCDNHNYYGLCGLQCDGYTKQECKRGECAICACESENVKAHPYCCYGNDYANICEAKCDGYRKEDCFSGECADCGCDDIEEPVGVCCVGGERFDSMCEAECMGFVANQCQEYDGKCRKPEPQPNEQDQDDEDYDTDSSAGMTASDGDAFFLIPTDESFAFQISEWWIHAHPTLVWVVIWCGMATIIAVVVYTLKKIRDIAIRMRIHQK